MRYPTKTSLRAAAGLAAILALAACGPQSHDPDRTWRAYNGGPAQTHYSALDEINRENVKQLAKAWSFDTGDAFPDSEMQVNPIVIDRTMFIVSPRLRVFALDAGTGKELWRFDPMDGRKSPNSKKRSRGLTHWTDGRQQRLFFAARQYLYAIDAKTGKLDASFGQGGKVDLREGLERDSKFLSVASNTPGMIYKDLLILGSTGFTPGHVRAYDVRTGKIAWTFHTIPKPGQVGHDTWPKDGWERANGANAWAGMALDEKRGLVFVPTASGGMGDKDFYGADRKGDNLFANSIVALKAATGERVWHFQTVRHDLWDRDLPAPPTLVTLKRDGKSVDAVVQITKSGFIYVLDRETGKPLFQVKDRPVPASDIPGETAAATQPFPVAPEPFARQRVTEDILTRRTPEAHAAALATFKQVRTGGQFTPPSLAGTFILPGLDGGGEWGGGTFDPETGLYYVNANEMAWILKLRKRPPPGPALSGKAVFMNECSACHGADMKGAPPEFPSLVGVRQRMSDLDAFLTVAMGSGRMPGFSRLGEAPLKAVVEYLLTGRDVAVPGSGPSSPVMADSAEYMFDGYTKFLDPDGFPAIAPPWGTLSAIDLNTGRYAWRIPFGEYPALAADGAKPTGSQNYGGSVVTRGGVLFIGATVYDNKFRAFDKASGKLLWETTLPAAANATPAVYQVDGRQFVAIAAGGGKNPYGPTGGTIFAFALPKTK